MTNDDQIQDIFNRVIDSGCYKYDSKGGVCSRYMCHSLAYAKHRGVITDVEMTMALEEIKEYMKPTGYEALENALASKKLGGSFEHRLNVYRDWKNRPFLGNTPCLIFRLIIKPFKKFLTR